MKTLLKRATPSLPDSSGSSPRSRLGLGGNQAGAPRPSRAGDVSADEDAETIEKPAQARYTTGSHLMTRGISYLLMGALVCGPAALVVGLLDDGPAPLAQAKDEVTHDTVARRSVASEQAAVWVQAWLTTPSARAAELKQWWPGPVSLPKAASQVSDVRVVDATPTAPGVWAVTVSASVTPAGGKSHSRNFYMVPVQVDGGSGDAAAAVKAVPSVVQAPATAKNPGSPYGVTLPSSSPVEASVQAFMSAYLAGEGEVSRYTTPGSPLHAVAEAAPYESVEVQSIRVTERAENLSEGQAPTDGQVLHVLVETVTTDPGPGAPSTRQRSASWPLTITARDGRWEITDLDGTFQTTAETNSADSNTSTKE